MLLLRNISTVCQNRWEPLREVWMSGNFVNNERWAHAKYRETPKFAESWPRDFTLPKVFCWCCASMYRRFLTLTLYNFAHRDRSLCFQLLLVDKDASKYACKPIGNLLHFYASFTRDNYYTITIQRSRRFLAQDVDPSCVRPKCTRGFYFPPNWPIPSALFPRIFFSAGIPGINTRKSV